MENTSIPTDYSKRAAFTVKEWCRDVHPMAVAVAYAEINSGRLKSYKIGARRYIPATEREAYPARVAGETA
jgi:hypothetical protein